jgi:hypothetical protein
VDCYTPDNQLAGYVWLTGDEAGNWTWDGTIYLDGRTCGAIENALANSPRNQRFLRTEEGSYILGDAMLTLEHEALHARLLTPDEGIVECTAYRNLWSALDYLHLPWKVKREVYLGGQWSHEQIPTTGEWSEYRSVC